MHTVAKACLPAPNPAYRPDHAFDLPTLRLRLRLDFYATVRLINYIRDQVRRGLVPDFTNPLHYAADLYLRPVLQDDRLLIGM